MQVQLKSNIGPDVFVVLHFNKDKQGGELSFDSKIQSGYLDVGDYEAIPFNDKNNTFKIVIKRINSNNNGDRIFFIVNGKLPKIDP